MAALKGLRYRTSGRETGRRKTMTEWDAERYHRLSDPQVAWGQRVLDRLAPAAGETILDIGCGTGRLTAQLAAASGDGLVVGLDASAAMLAQAREWLARQAPRVRLVRADAAALPFAETFDAVFSAATLHWVPNHAAAFRSIFRALRPGGRLVAQCGGGPNLARLLERTHALMSGPRFGRHFGVWRDPWYFADEASTIVSRCAMRPRTATSSPVCVCGTMSIACRPGTVPSSWARSRMRRAPTILPTRSITGA
jgi:ubiquinone/menaquinone biosynthesis C-methylase UbiE